MERLTPRTDQVTSISSPAITSRGTNVFLFRVIGFGLGFGLDLDSPRPLVEGSCCLSDRCCVDIVVRVCVSGSGRTAQARQTPESRV